MTKKQEPQIKKVCKHCLKFGDTKGIVVCDDKFTVNCPAWPPQPATCPDLQPEQPTQMPLTQVAKPDEHYTTHCFGCGTEKQLMMIPTRRQEHIVGWIFSCAKCESNLIGRLFDSSETLQAHDIELAKQVRQEFIDTYYSNGKVQARDQQVAAKARKRTLKYVEATLERAFVNLSPIEQGVLNICLAHIRAMAEGKE